jgi:hypothetical protein
MRRAAVRRKVDVNFLGDFQEENARLWERWSPITVRREWYVQSSLEQNQGN